MRIPMRAALRLALTGWLGLAGLSLVAAQGRAATPPEKVLPDSTIALRQGEQRRGLRESFRQSQFGQLWNDPALKALKERPRRTARRVEQVAQGEARRHVPRAVRAAAGDRRDRASSSATIPSSPPSLVMTPTPARTPRR